MRILSNNFVQQFKHKIINIHHSFLPAFIGANPYEKAYARGVKIIGATAHFVTKDLDEGPIIAQDIQHVNHNHTLEEMKKSGKTIEKNTLIQALKLIIEDKVFIINNKTIIF
jgi:formyltetrahydrofolate deformylase